MNDDKKDNQQASQPSKDSKLQVKWSEWFPREGDNLAATLGVIQIKGIRDFQKKDEKK